MKYLILKFENAGLFNNHKGTKDRIVLKRMGGNIERNNNNFKEPITIYQISNIIHCLFGERPVPTFRKVFYDPIDYYFNKAKDSYLKIDSYKHHNIKNGNEYYPKEKVHTKKMVYNAWSKQTDFNWFKLEKYLSNVESLFDFFVNESNKIFNCDVKNISVCELRNKYLLCDQSQYKHIIDKLYEHYKSTLVDFLTIKDYKNESHINAKYSNGLSRTVNNSVDSISLLDGFIYIPVTEDDIDRIKKVSSGVCTILDGGLVYIDSVRESYEINQEGLIRVGDISTDVIIKE